MTSKIVIGHPELPALQRQALINLYRHGVCTALEIDAYMQTMRALERRGLVTKIGHGRGRNKHRTLEWRITDAGRRAIGANPKEEPTP